MKMTFLLVLVLFVLLTSCQDNNSTTDLAITMSLLEEYREELSNGQCEEVPLQIRDICYEHYAKIDPNACKKISTTRGQDLCFDSVVFDNPDLELCHNIGNEDLRNACYFQQAQDRANTTMCQNITVDYLHSGCIDSIVDKTGQNYCDEILNEEEQGYCYFSLAQNNNNVSYCYDITSPTRMYDCLYRNGFLYHATTDICNQLPRTSPAWNAAFTNCLKTMVLVLNITNTTLCESYNVSCTTHVAANAKNETLCENAPVWEKEMCYYRVAVATLNPDLCSHVHYPVVDKVSQQEFCESWVEAIKDKKPENCENISVQCYEDYAIYHQDPSYCHHLLSPHWKMCELRASS